VQGFASTVEPFESVASRFKPVVLGPTASDDPKYNKLVDLKKLLDSGVITQQEFASEGAKILNRP
jgi:hypothetical protein